MKSAASIFDFTCYLSVAVIGLGFATPNARAQRSSSEARLAVPDGPFEQWDTITFSINLNRNSPSPEAEKTPEIDLSITSPSGAQLIVPAFPDSNDADFLSYQCRFTPREVGPYAAKILGTNDFNRGSNSVKFEVSPSSAGRGFLRVDSNTPYFMQFDNGDQFRGIGTNIGWEPRRRSHQEFTYDALFPKISAHGLNTARTWMCPWNMPIEWNSPSLGEYDDDALRRMDEMFALAEQNGIYVVLVLGYHGELQTVSGSFPNNDRWKENPYNVANGGPCETPADFFTNEQAKSLYKKRLRTLVARVACRPQLLAWEFWNEIDHIERRGPVPGDAIVAWHQEMADYLRSIDVYDHPITTSISVQAPPGLWEVEDIDLIMLHPYGVTDNLATLLAQTNARYNKPAIAEEFSYSWKPAKEDEEDDFERELRLGLWRGLMSPTPVLPMTWWWEFHDARGDWQYFRPVADFSNRMIEMDDSNWRSVQLKASDDAIECQGIAIGNTIFLWLRNSSEAPASDVSIEFQEVLSDGVDVRQFDTLAGDFLDGNSCSLRTDRGVSKLFVPSLGGHRDVAFILARPSK